jgi:hypothetical protein
MADSKNVLKLILIALVSLVALGFIIWGTVWLVNNLPSQIKSIGATQTSTAIPASSIVGKIAGVLLGAPLPLTYEGLILFLAIFVILLFALAEIVEMFSTFSSTASWMIALGLAIIAGVTKMIAAIAAVFGLTAGIGAIGIAIIIIMAIVAAVVINLGFGKAIQAWALQRQIGVASAKAAKGFAKVKEGAKGLRDLADEMERE